MTTSRIEMARAAAAFRLRVNAARLEVLPHIGAPVMNITKKTVLWVLTSTALAVGLCACDRNGDTPGQTLDKGLNKAGDKIKEAGEAMKTK